jgi:hypothetical protein
MNVPLSFMHLADYLPTTVTSLIGRLAEDHFEEPRLLSQLSDNLPPLSHTLYNSYMHWLRPDIYRDRSRINTNECLAMINRRNLPLQYDMHVGVIVKPIQKNQGNHQTRPCTHSLMI